MPFINDASATLLYNAWTNANATATNAPGNLKTATINYYSYAGSGVDSSANFIKSQLTSQATEISNQIRSEFDTMVTRANGLNEILHSLETNAITNMNDLYAEYQNQGIDISQNIVNAQSDISIMNRKTYYEKQSIDYIRWWHDIYWWIYYLLAIVFAISVLVSKSTYSMWYTGSIAILLFIYPYFSTRLIIWVFTIFYNMTRVVPKSVYLNL